MRRAAALAASLLAFGLSGCGPTSLGAAYRLFPYRIGIDAAVPFRAWVAEQVSREDGITDDEFARLIRRNRFTCLSGDAENQRICRTDIDFPVAYGLLPPFSWEVTDRAALVVTALRSDQGLWHFPQVEFERRTDRMRDARQHERVGDRPQAPA